MKTKYNWFGSLLCLSLLACSADDTQPGVTRRASPNRAAAGSFGLSAGSAATGTAATSGSLIPNTLGNANMNTHASCAGTNVQAGRKQPIVTLVIDGSGSMCAAFGNATRWTALRSALMDADGVVAKLQGVVSFGMTLYDGPIDLTGFLGGLGTGGGGRMGGGGQNPQCASMSSQNSMNKSCPNMVEVPVALNNAQAIAAMYPMQELGGSTPTHKVMTAVVDKLLQARMAVPDVNLQPQYIVLATDGEPNELCANPSGVDPRAEVINQVTRAAQAGIKTFVISLAGGDSSLMDHLVKVAQAGMTGYPPFTPMSKQDLVMSLGQIIGGAVGCEVFLNGKVAAGQECAGTVQVNGVSLQCNDPNGWGLKDDHTLELKGTACTMFENDPLSMLHADFPCGVFVPS
jgi:Mg-chelatase subunit ChlD